MHDNCICHIAHNIPWRKVAVKIKNALQVFFAPITSNEAGHILTGTL
jgi:hypothetical protein